MTKPQDLVFLFDVDNTLIDNDKIQLDLRNHLATNYGVNARDRYWELFEELRNELGYTDYLGALERYRVEELHNPRVLRIANCAGCGAARAAMGSHGDPFRWRRGFPAPQGGAFRTVARSR